MAAKQRATEKGKGDCGSGCTEKVVEFQLETESEFKLSKERIQRIPLICYGHGRRMEKIIPSTADIVQADLWREQEDQKERDFIQLKRQ